MDWMKPLGAAALKFFTAHNAAGYRLETKQEAEEIKNGKADWYEVQWLVYDGNETRWRMVARTGSYSAATAVRDVEKAKNPVGSYDIRRNGFKREVLGWRIVHLTEETWRRTKVVQLSAEVINNGNLNKEER